MHFHDTAEFSWIYDLYRMGQDTALFADPADVQRRILKHVVDGIAADSGSLSLCMEQDDELELTAGIGLPPQAIGKRIAKGSGVIGWVFEHQDSLLLTDDPSRDPRFCDLVPRDASRVPGSAICWPLQQESRLIGALCVNRNEGRPPFTEEDRERGHALVNMISVVIENTRLHLQQAARIEALSELNRKLEEAQNQLLQSEKMASIGQLAAGVAHEINNPIGFVQSNLSTLERYHTDLFALIDCYERLESDASPAGELAALKQKVGLSFLKEDIPALMAESLDGIGRVKLIVQNLKDFSRVDTANKYTWSDLHAGIDSTLNIVMNEIKYKAEIVKQYGELPEVECLASELNQVFMNILINAAHAIDGYGQITIRTGVVDDHVWIEIADNGQGISKENLTRIFEPFFTTKPVGRGTGLGLSLSYSIVQKHRGEIQVSSEPGEGSVFRVTLPVCQSGAVASAA